MKKLLAAAVAISLTAAAALPLAACMTTAQKVHGADGQQYSRIECNGAVQTMAACYDKANEMCPNGYFLKNEDQRNAGQIGGGASSIGWGRGWGSGQAFGSSTPILERSIVVGCK